MVSINRKDLVEYTYFISFGEPLWICTRVGIYTNSKFTADLFFNALVWGRKD